MAEKEIHAAWADSFGEAGSTTLDWGEQESAIILDNGEKALSLFEAINKAAEEYQSTTITTGEIIKAILEDQAAKNKKLHDQELKYQKTIQKMKWQSKMKVHMKSQEHLKK